MIARIRQIIAAKKLDRIREATANSPAIVQFRKHRDAAKLGHQRRKEARG